jgi:hypothetical protein
MVSVAILYYRKKWYITSLLESASDSEIYFILHPMLTGFTFFNFLKQR